MAMGYFKNLYTALDFSLFYINEGLYTVFQNRWQLTLWFQHG